MSDETARPPSMVDVARAAGVALVTVSRVLNGSDAVRPETRRRVEAAVTELNYRRNDLARTLKRGRSTTLGVVIAGAELYELSKILLGVETTARAGGYWVSMMSSQSGKPGQLGEAVRRLSEQLVEGIVVIADRPTALLDLESLETGMPVTVVMSGDVANPYVGSVEVDQVFGARLATRHLLDLGHRSIAHISGPSSVFDAQARVAGWEQELESRSDARGRLVEGDFEARSGYRITKELWEDQRRPTAVFAGNDRMAMGVFAALAELGVAVPGEVSVVGFDDMAGSEFLVPSLTTIRQDFRALGESGTRLLFDLMSGEQPGHHLLEPTLVVRSSSGPAR